MAPASKISSKLQTGKVIPLHKKRMYALTKEIQTDVNPVPLEQGLNKGFMQQALKIPDIK